MQGTLNEIDIRSILQLIELGQRTGELFVEAYPCASISSGKSIFGKQRQFSAFQQFWLLFFVNGQIAYAANHSNSNLLRLRDYLYPYKAEEAINHLGNSSIATTNIPEYAYLWLLLEKKIITPEQGYSILEKMVQETLFDLLSFHQGTFIFEISSALTPQLTTLQVTPVLTKTIKQIQQWKQWYPYIQSPNQCLLINDQSQLSQALPKQVYHNLLRWTDGKTSLCQLSRYLNRDLITLARAIFPYLERGWLQLIEPIPQEISAWQAVKEVKGTKAIPHIVCIDDNLTIGKKVESILERQGYQATIISNPVQALSLLFQLEPDLILCDITMPKLDGYEVCAMLRHSQAFRQTPIVMLTAQEAFIDRIKARMVGATDYLTKPFGENELLLLLEKYLLTSDL